MVYSLPIELAELMTNCNLKMSFPLGVSGAQHKSKRYI